MRFQVPQFIGVEDKIFGPLTIKQFIYLAGGAGMGYLVYRLLNFLPTFIVFIPITAIIALALALTFAKPNGKPFVFFLENLVRYFVNGKLYIWKKEEKKATKTEEKPQDDEALLYVPKLSNSKLKDLTWSLDVKESMNPGTRETMEQK